MLHYLELEKMCYYINNKSENMYNVVYRTHNIVVGYCEYCGKPMSESDVNDYGSLCEECYMEEYYND